MPTTLGAMHVLLRREGGTNHVGGGVGKFTAAFLAGNTVRAGFVIQPIVN